MGAWGPGVFENDDAADWLTAGTCNLQTLEQAFGDVLGVAGYIDGTSAAVALAAVEVVAAAAGHPGSRLPAEATQCATLIQSVISSELVDRSEQVIDAIVERSELRDLWEDSGSVDAWLAELSNLKVRLSQITPSGRPPT